MAEIQKAGNVAACDGQCFGETSAEPQVRRAILLGALTVIRTVSKFFYPSEKSSCT
ncbi:MAG TPA: hypothetical protein VF443_16525 [Nitrospira sp.]